MNRDLLRTTFERVWGRTPTEQELDQVLSQSRERNYPKIQKPISRDRQMLYGLGMTGLGKLGGAYMEGVGKDIANTGLKNTWLGKLYEDSLLEQGINSLVGGGNEATSYLPNINATDIAPKNTNFDLDLSSMYKDSLLEDAINYLFY